MTELPPHWSSLALGELCSSVEKVDPTNLGRDDFWYVDIGALEPSSSSLEKVINIPTANAPGRARQLIRNGDSIFATVRPYMKKVAYIPKEFDGQIASTGFCVLRPIQEKLHSKYLFYFLLSDQLLDQVLPLQRGVSYPAIRDNDLKNAHIPIPPIDEQNKIVELLEDHLVLEGEALAQLDEVLAGDGDLSLGIGLVRRFEGRVVRQARIASDAEVVLNPALSRQPIVVPTHRVEHLEPAHALVTRDAVGVRVGEHVADV